MESAKERRWGHSFAPQTLTVPQDFLIRQLEAGNGCESSSLLGSKVEEDSREWLEAEGEGNVESLDGPPLLRLAQLPLEGVEEEGSGVPEVAQLQASRIGVLTLVHSGLPIGSHVNDSVRRDGPTSRSLWGF